MSESTAAADAEVTVASTVVEVARPVRERGGHAWCLGASCGLHALLLIALWVAAGPSVVPPKLLAIELVDAGNARAEGPGTGTPVPPPTVSRRAPAVVARPQPPPRPATPRPPAAIDAAPSSAPSSAPPVSLAPEPGAAGQSEATPAPATGEFTGSTNATPEGEADGAGGRRGSAPSLGHLVQPRYPESARRAGIQGRALLAVTVHADGTVGDIRLKQSAGHDDLDAAAVDAVKRWRFAPAQRWGTAVDFCCVEIPIDFHLH